MNDTDRLALYREAAEVLEGLGYETSVREDYSGRGMYGDTAPAIVSEAPPALVGWAVTVCHVSRLATDGQFDLMDLDNSDAAIPRSTDSMGRSATVLY